MAVPTMAVFTKALTNKWAPNVGRSSNEPRENAPGPSAMIGQVGETLWDTGVSKDYRVTYLGQIRQSFPLICSSQDNPVDVQIVDVVEEAQLKGLIPMEANSALHSPRGRLGNNLTSSAPEFSRPRPCTLTLSIHGVRIFDASSNSSKSNDVLLRQPLHSILSGVSFQSQKVTLIALAVTPESETPFTGIPGAIDGVEGVAPFFASSFASPSSADVIFASCFVFQASSAEDGATFVRDLKDVFVAAMRAKASANHA